MILGWRAWAAHLLLIIGISLAPSISAQDLKPTTIITAAQATPQARAATELLRDEAAKRPDLAFGKPGDALIIARRDEIAGLLPTSDQAQWQKTLRRLPPVTREAYTIAHFEHSVVVAGDDDRGILFGAGYLLRKGTSASDTYAAPQMCNRAHQIGYRYKNNSYDAFTLAMFEQQVRDLAVFGANGIQWIAPISDDATDSPLFHAPPLTMAIGVSALMQKYGLDFDLYYPEMGDDYAKPETRAIELARFEALVKQLPRIDALYVPGGDPGHTHPDVLFGLVKAQAKILHRYHPDATIWISGQGFDQGQFERFYALLDQQPDWLTGVFFGPQSRDPLPVQRARIPKRYPIIFYPDIAHTLHAQFPVPQWDPAYALTQGREPVNPQPRAQSHIIRHFAADYSGFVTYSEGVNDDVNKTLWSELGWNVNANVDDVLADYARYFIGDPRFAEGLKRLERNWDGPVVENRGITATLDLLESMAPAHADNWRFNMAYYRATYDAYVQKRAIAEQAREARAYAAIGEGRVSEARSALEVSDGPETIALRTRLFDIAGYLYNEIGLQLSVKLYGASGIERGANLDRVDASLNDRVWLEQKLNEIDALRDPLQKSARLTELAAGDKPPPGGFYDDLGNPGNEPHLERGLGFIDDPQAYTSSIDGVADITPDDGWRMAWVTYAETLYERPITLRYKALNPQTRYQLKIVYAGEGYALPVKLTGNGAVLHDFTERKTNPMTVELDVPQNMTKGGRLTLEWTRPDGMGGSGRGHQVAQVWLLPMPNP